VDIRGVVVEILASLAGISGGWHPRSVGLDADRYFGNNSPCRRGRVHREDGRPTI